LIFNIRQMLMTALQFRCSACFADGSSAVFFIPFVNLGLCPEAVSSLLTPPMLGYHRAAAA
jgi:enoyl-CoA hydratase/carnithine racemase